MELVDVAHSLPQAERLNLQCLRAKYGWSDRNHRIFSRMFGLKSAALHPGVALKDTLSISASGLAKRNPELIGNVDYVFYCHAVNTTIPVEQGILEQLVRETFECEPEVMSVTHASCATAIMVIRMLQSLPTNDSLNVVILTGEKCYFELLQYAENQGLYGEVTSAVFLKVGENNGTQIIATVSGTFDGLFAPMVDVSKEVTQAFDQAFLPRMTRLVNRLLDSADMDPEDIDVIFPTHLSPFTSDKVAHQVGMTNAKVWKTNLPHIGHCYCSDLFINYQTWLFDHPDDAMPINILSFASGMTGSYAGIVLTRS